MWRSSGTVGALLCVLLVHGPAVLGSEVAHPVAPPRVEVTLELSVGGEEPVEITTYLGGMVTFDDRNFNVKLGLRPAVVDFDLGEVLLEVETLDGRRGRFRSKGVVDSITCAVGATTSTALGGALVDVRVIRTSIVLEDESRQSGSGQASGRGRVTRSFTTWNQGEPCCVTCGSTNACGCSVSSSCGGCGPTC